MAKKRPPDSIDEIERAVADLAVIDLPDDRDDPNDEAIAGEGYIAEPLEPDDDESFAGVHPPGTPGHELEVAKNVAEAHERGVVLAEDSDPTISRLKGQLATSHAEISRLEGDSATVALEDGNLDAHLKKLTLARERIAPLTHALETARGTYRRTRAAEAKAALEANASKVAAEVVPALVGDWKRLYAALQEVVRATDALQRNTGAISDLNYQVKNARRDDLAINPHRVRIQAAEEILGRSMMVQAAEVSPRRGKMVTVPTHVDLTDSSKVLATKEVWEGESEESYMLRKGNAESQAISATAQADPFLHLGDLVEGRIETFIFALDPHQRARNRRMMSARAMPDANGNTVFRDTPGSAAALPGSPQIGPYVPGYVEKGPGSPDLLRGL